jgi:predicted DNA-binding transcriptional regulator AlpA
MGIAEGIKMGCPAEVLALEPRGLNRVQAAAYVGVSPTLFDEMVQDRRMPQPKRINSRRVWDRKRLDEAFEALLTRDEIVKSRGLTLAP